MKQLLTKSEYKRFKKAQMTIGNLVWQIEERLGGDLFNLVNEYYCIEKSQNTDVATLVTNLSNINISIQDNDIEDLVGKKLSKQDVKRIQHY